MILSSSAFAFDVNSKQSTPSPMSHTAAEPFFSTGFATRLMSSSMMTPGGRVMS